MSIEVTYNGIDIPVNDGTPTVLATNGKAMVDDITINYAGGGGGGQREYIWQSAISGIEEVYTYSDEKALNDFPNWVSYTPSAADTGSQKVDLISAITVEHRFNYAFDWQNYNYILWHSYAFRPIYKTPEFSGDYRELGDYGCRIEQFFWNGNWVDRTSGVQYIRIDKAKKGTEGQRTANYGVWINTVDCNFPAKNANPGYMEFRKGTAGVTENRYAVPASCLRDMDGDLSKILWVWKVYRVPRLSDCFGQISQAAIDYLHGGPLPSIEI